MGKHIDLTRMSAHFMIDRKFRIDLIERTIGWGTEVVVAPDKMGQDATATLTSTGVMIIRNFDGLIITAWIASVPEAVSVWIRAKGNNHLPKWLWNVVNYNNNTAAWQKMAA